MAPSQPLNYGRAQDVAMAGQIALEESRFEEASEYFKRALRMGVFSVEEEAQLRCQLSESFEKRGLYREALEAVSKYEKMPEFVRLSNPTQMSTLIRLGWSCSFVNDIPKSIALFNQALYIARRLDDDAGIGACCLGLGRAYRNLNELRAQTKWWGMMMRMDARIAAAQGHIAAAIQSLGQSTSIFEIKGSVYEIAFNRVEFAELLRRQGRIESAMLEVETALEVFRQLGAAADERNAIERLAALKQTLTQAESHTSALTYALAPAPDLVSVIDGFMTRRLAQAAVFRELLIQELASIIHQQANSRAALVAEADGNNLKLKASVGLNESEKQEAIQFLRQLSPEERRSHFVYTFDDSRKANYLLYIIAPRSERFLSGAISLEPLLDLVKLSLEVESQRSKSRRTQVFNPARLLEQVELPGFICASRAMSSVLEQIHKIRSSDVTVLITGESGTGKELIARAVHAGSSRRFNTFLPFNCSAAPKDMVESQMFGYRKGAFTGAIQSNEGVVRAAERGTLFLDEIGDLPLDLQPKLLRFLQEGEIHPIGETQPLKVDVRVVAATNSELERAVAEGKFREDLFHRLNVIRIQVPPLRQRREEIPALINYYLNLYQKEAAKNEIKLSEEALDLLVVYDWPGNVRQLCNEVRRIVAYGESSTVITPDGLSPEIIRASREMDSLPAASKKLPESANELAEGVTLAVAVEELERRMIQDALRRSSGNIARAAKELGLSRKGLYLKMDRLNFDL